MKSIFIRISTLLLLSVAFNAFAAEPAYPERIIEEAIETKVKALLKNFEPDATVIVKVEQKKADAVLPSTPFQVKGITIQSEAGKSIRSIGVTIYGSKAELPKPVQTLIEQLVVPYGVRPQITLKLLPQELLPENRITSDASEKLKNLFDSERIEKTANFVFYFIFGTVLIFIGLLFLNGYLDRKKSDQIFDRFESNMHNFSDALTESSGGRNHAGRQESTASLGRTGDNEVQDYSPTSETPSVVRLDSIRLSAVGLKALLMDCYWNEKDAYAVFIWNRIPFEVREELTKDSPLLGEYISSSGHLKPLDLALENDPAYLHPLPIERFNQNTLTEIVRLHPEVLGSLPRLRADHLKLSALEQIDLHQVTPKNSQTPFDDDFFSSFPASLPRSLVKAWKVTLSSIEEEEQILAREGLNLQIKAGVPSLGWSRALSPKETTELLKTYSARDLAQAWIGPNEVLTRLEKCLPEKKRSILNEYREKIAPSRTSIPFTSLHEEIIRRLTLLPENMHSDNSDDESTSLPPVRRIA